MNLKFLKTLNEDHEKYMSSDEMKTYLELLYKKCSKSVKSEFDDYLKKECDVEEVDLGKCAGIICKDKERCDKVIHHLENLSGKLDENSLFNYLNESTNPRYVMMVKKAALNMENAFNSFKHNEVDRIPTEMVRDMKRISEELKNMVEKLELL